MNTIERSYSVINSIERLNTVILWDNPLKRGKSGILGLFHKFQKNSLVPYNRDNFNIFVRKVFFKWEYELHKS